MKTRTKLLDDTFNFVYKRIIVSGIRESVTVELNPFHIYLFSCARDNIATFALALAHPLYQELTHVDYLYRSCNFVTSNIVPGDYCITFNPNTNNGFSYDVTMIVL